MRPGSFLRRTIWMSPGPRSLFSPSPVHPTRTGRWTGSWPWRGIGRRADWQILFGGGPGERDALESVRQAGFPVSAGVSLLVTGGLMKLSSLILGGDTGALHLAVAMGKRVVMFRHSVAPGSPHPYQHPDWAVTPACGRVVSSIEIGAVIEACERAFNERAGNASC